MRKITKEAVKVEQLINRSLTFATEVRLRLRRKLNKKLDDIIEGESEIVNAISNVPIKLSKKNRYFPAQHEGENVIRKLKEEEDKKTWLIKF